MNIILFDDKYSQKGGSKALKRMMSDFSSSSDIAMHFGVTRQRVKQWIWDMFGERYDPRYERKRDKIKIAKAVIESVGWEESKKLYQNHYYLRMAAKELKNEK